MRRRVEHARHCPSEASPRRSRGIDSDDLDDGVGELPERAHLEHLGAGEVLLNSIDRDGAMAGYDLALARKIRQAVSIPMTVLGGAGSLRHIDELIGELGTVGAAAGSLFVFKGVYRAVLISYPGSADRDALFGRAQRSQALQVGERR